MYRRRRTVVLGYVGYAVASIIFLGPLLFMVWGSLRQNSDIVASELAWSNLTLDNFVRLFEEFELAQNIISSFVIAGGSTLVGLLLGVPISYVVSRFGLNGLGFFMLLVRMAPGVLFVVPLFLLSINIGAQGNRLLTYALLISAHLIITLPLAIWFMLPFFDGVPDSVYEAAELDGCSLPQIFRRVALPVCMPGLAVTSTLSFIFSWNYFLFALILAGSDTAPLPVIAFNFIGVGQSDWGGLMAASLLIASPAIVLAFLSQRLIVRGMTAGAVR